MLVFHSFLFPVSRYPRVRKATAEKLYEALITNDDIFPAEAQEETEDVEEASSTQSECAMTLLSETQWDGKDLNDVRPIRNELCQLFGIPPPVAVPKTVTQS